MVNKTNKNNENLIGGEQTQKEEDTMVKKEWVRFKSSRGWVRFKARKD